MFFSSKREKRTAALHSAGLSDWGHCCLGGRGKWLSPIPVGRLCLGRRAVAPHGWGDYRCRQLWLVCAGKKRGGNYQNPSVGASPGLDFGHHGTLGWEPDTWRRLLYGSPSCRSSILIWSSNSTRIGTTVDRRNLGKCAALCRSDPTHSQ